MKRELSKPYNSLTVILQLLLVILTIIFATFILPINVFADEEIEASKNIVELSLQDTESEDIEVALNYQIQSTVSGYDLELQYPDYLSYKAIRVGNGNCPPEIVTTQENRLTIYCFLPPGKSLDLESNIATLVFDVNGKGSEKIKFMKSEFDDLVVETNGIYIKTDLDPQKGYFIEGFTLVDAITWLGLIALVGGGIAIYVYFTKKGKSSRDDQMVFFTLLGLVVISGTAAVVLALGVDNYDLREEAAPVACVQNCTDRTCGSDGCGGLCGICGKDESCSEEGMCIKDFKHETINMIEFCEYDSDCIKVSSDCCSCEFGGKERAINKERKLSYESDLGCNESVLCTGAPSCTQSEAVCLENRCILDNESVLGASSTPVNFYDIDGNGVVQIEDYVVFLDDYQNWQYNGHLEGRSDFNEDSIITTFDYLIFIEGYFE